MEDGAKGSRTLGAVCGPGLLLGGVVGYVGSERAWVPGHQL